MHAKLHLNNQDIYWMNLHALPPLYMSPSGVAWCYADARKYMFEDWSDIAQKYACEAELIVHNVEEARESLAVKYPCLYCELARPPPTRLTTLALCT